MPAYFYRNLIKQLTHTSITEKNPKKLKNCMMPTPIQNLLIQQKLWRFLGLVSTPVGLLCFALSTSFKQLFGEWNFLKIFVYTLVSSIVCSLMLFAHKFQPSCSLLLKAQVGFLVFMLTSYYSFLYGQKANGKPDICSLDSSGSFALMSFSLSRQIHLGFEVDMFNFFLGYFLVQLMTIHLMLAFVGAVFCYLLMYLRSYLDSQAQNGTVVAPVDQVALQIDGPSRVQVEAGSEFNEKHLYVILGIEEKKEERVIFPTNMEDKIKELSCTGFVEECSHVYLTWRRQILDEKMLKIGLHKLDIKEIKNVPLDYLDKKVQRWIMASDYVLRVLLPDERNISNSVFLGCSDYANLRFMELCKGSMTQLLNFANAVATGTGSPVRLFRIIKMFEALRDLLPDIKSLFYDKHSVVLRDEAITIWERLRDAIKGVFMDLEYLISRKKEPSIGVVPGGGIHPITHYVMNYLCSACQYLRTLEQVFGNHHGRTSTSSPLCFQFERIVELLEKNLAANSEMYKDSALCYVFMMNNKRYIIKSAKHSKLRELLGDNWIQNQIAQFHQCLVNYYESSWEQVIGTFYLDDESLASSSLGLESFKQKLSMFILQFERICEVQSTWVIFDENVRERIKSSMERTLLTEYENFTARFQNVMETRGNNMCSDFGFGVQDIVAGIGKLFQVTDELKKHRKMQPTWTVVVPNIEDFHECWWKSSQDTFLDSSYPIYYYSCVHKLDQGCQATVQVQQIQENPPMYGTKYTGLHTCRLHANVPQMVTED